VRLAYFGTSEFAATILRRIAASPYRPVLVLTPPDRRRGRGRKSAPPPAAIAARELDLAFHQSADVNDEETRAALDLAGVDLGLVCAFGQLLRAPLLDRVELLNVHPSLLPRWRGAAPIERALMAGDSETGVAIIKVGEELDAGPVALCETVPIDSRDDFASLAERLAAVGGELAVDALARHEAGELRFTPQAEQGMTYAGKVEPAERRLDPGRPAAELERIVRALNPHLGTYLELDSGERLGVTRAEPVAAPRPAPGDLAQADGTMVLGCVDGALRIVGVRPPGKREMAAADYLRGHPLPRVAPTERAP